MKKILIADDNRIFLDRINTWLVDAGYIVLRARNLSEYSKSSSPPAELDLIIVGALGPGTNITTQGLAQNGKCIMMLTMAGDPRIPRIPTLPLTCTEAELLDKVRELLQGATQ
jgi:hypothetical protein